MARCTDLKEGHRTASGRANCPVCGRGYSSYPTYSKLNNVSPYSSNNHSSSYSGKSQKVKVSWAKRGSSLLYTTAEINTLKITLT